MSERTQVTNATLMDVIGRQYQLTGSTIGEREISFDLNQMGLPPGLYMLRLSFDNQQKELLRIFKR
jgi:hypothetical protein